MSQGTRLFVVSGLALVVGAAAGAYATQLVYGDSSQQTVDPSPAPIRECPACPACPACPPPPDCGDLSVIPSTPDDLIPSAPMHGDGSEDPLGEDGNSITPPPSRRPAGPGLSARAIQQATAAVRVAVRPCLEAENTQTLSGMLLLDLTVTATGSEGFVTEALISQRSGDVGQVDVCVQKEALGARFEHEGPEGEQRVKLPLQVGRRY